MDEILNTGRLLTAVLSDVINGRVTEFAPDTDFEKLYRLAEAHKVTALAGLGIVNNETASEKARAVFSKQVFRTAARHAAQQRETEELSSLFSQNGISHCFLKGTKISRFYDTPDSRFMLDLDIFIEEKGFDRACELVEERGYELFQADDKDSEYVKKPFLHIELHRKLKYDYDTGSAYFDSAAEHLVSSGEDTALNMTNEDFYVYIISHTAHHFEVAGTGLRSFTDHYYLRKKLLPECDAALLKEKLAAAGLLKFAGTLDGVCDYWFAGGEETELIKQTADYIILSGVYGNTQNSYINGVLKRGLSENSGVYFLSRLFPPLEDMKIRYPVLKKLPVLLPLLWIARLFSSLFSAKRIAGEAKTAVSADSEDIAARKNFFNSVGL